MQIYIVYFMIFVTFYILGAYATTDILRLLKGSSTSIDAPDCYCPICNSKIPLKHQLPIIAYFRNHGSCFNCHSRIPVSDLFLEIFIFAALSAIALFSRFTWIGYAICVAFYEATKLVFLLIHGRRDEAFVKNLLCSLRNNMVLFLLLAFLFLLVQIV